MLEEAVAVVGGQIVADSAGLAGGGGGLADIDAVETENRIPQSRMVVVVAAADGQVVAADSDDFAVASLQPR